jgi:hypothetical protein
MQWWQGVKLIVECHAYQANFINTVSGFGGEIKGEPIYK